MKRPRWTLLVVVVLAAAAATAWWWTRSGDGAPAYKTAAVERGALQAVVAAGGTVNPVRQVSVGSQVSGQIKELRADFNTEVKQGQLIARIDPESSSEFTLSVFGTPATRSRPLTSIVSTSSIG